MSVFDSYARYYDLLYADKDYAAEVAYVDGLIREVVPSAKSLLDLGCGTGRHASLFASRGYDVVGIDRSETMLADAAKRANERIRFLHGDIGTTNAGQGFDAVVSLFHVFSYQTRQSDLKAAFANARAHLGEGGAFVFDFWYGPAVLTDRPQTRTRRLADDVIEVERRAEPVMHPNENVVEVNYHVRIREKASGREDELRESHRMRYLFLPEVEALLDDAGFEFVRAEEWMTGKPPGFETWGIVVLARVRGAAR